MKMETTSSASTAVCARDNLVRTAGGVDIGLVGGFVARRRNRGEVFLYPLDILVEQLGDALPVRRLQDHPHVVRHVYAPHDLRIVIGRGIRMLLAGERH